MDARACLSYQTVENRHAEVPESFRMEMGHVIFGCDICQDVCPLNRAPVATLNERFVPRAVAELGVEQLAALSPEDYERLVPGTALARAKYDGLRRNAVYALGALKQHSSRTLLMRLREDESEHVRHAARWALQHLDG